MKKILFLTQMILLFAGLIAYAQNKNNNKPQYELVEYPKKVSAFDAAKTNPFAYFDKAKTKSSANGNPEYVDISIFVGKAKTADEAVRKWVEHVERLELKYKNALKKYYLPGNLYGNFCWKKDPPCIAIRYRGPKEKYPRKGWYISTFSVRPPHDGEVDYGEFFLSDEGMLMVAMKVSSTSFYP